MGEDGNYQEISVGASESLLEYLKDPSATLESVDEEIYLQERVIRSDIHLRLREIQGSTFLPFKYVDITHPRRGVPVSVNILTDGVEIATHNEHQQACRDAIAYRFTSVIQAALVSYRLPDDVLEKLATAKLQIQEIPSLSPSRALRRLKHYFKEDGNLKWEAIMEYPLEAENEYVKSLSRALHRLCERLTRKYLLLIRVPTKTTSVRFTMERPYSFLDVDDNSLSNKKRHLLFGAIPTAFRYHVPWAKKTPHYSFTAHAPHGQFFAAADILLRKSEPGVTNQLTADTEVPFEWSRALNGGNKVAVFIGNGRSVSDRIFIGVTHREAPGRSLLRSLNLVTGALLLMLALFALRMLGFEVNAILSLVLALVAVGGIASTWPRGETPLGIPLLSRITPGVVALLTFGFLTWLQMLPNGETPSVVECTVGLVFQLAMTALLLRLLFRLKNQYFEFEHAVNAEVAIGGAFK